MGFLLFDTALCKNSMEDDIHAITSRISSQVQHAIITHVVNSRRTFILISAYAADSIRDPIISRVKGTTRDLTVISRASTKREGLAIPGITSLKSITRIMREIRKIIRSQKETLEDLEYRGVDYRGGG